MLELYIFNKESPAKNGLTYWEQADNFSESNELSFNLDRFKLKDNSQHILVELCQELNYFYKESEGLKTYFEDLNGSNIKIEIKDKHHHILSFNPETNKLTIDAKIENKFMPLYLFAVYYTMSRKSKSENEIYRNMFNFFISFEFKALSPLIEFLENDKQRLREYDAGGHLLNYLKNIFQKKNSIEFNHDSLTDKLQSIAKEAQISQNNYLSTQLLRNYALAGTLPFALERFEEIAAKYINDSFSGEAIEEYYQTYSDSFDTEYAKHYYNHLCFSLKQIGLQVVAQRGSRVAHEQGPILINSGSINVNEEFAVKVRKCRSSITESLSKLEESCNKFFNQAFLSKNSNSNEFNKFSQLLISINLALDTLEYLCSQKELAKARFEKTLNELETTCKQYLDAINNEALSIFSKQKNSKDKYFSFFDALQSQEKSIVHHIIELKELLDSSPNKSKNAVIYVQRPSSRSGHFIPRIIMGQNLYIETDEESERQRLDAIPFNFVCPELDLIASETDSFFENASISIVTDRDSGEPNIKWENAEDLAISLAPAMYTAIKSVQENGKRFHYQLETTLFGPLIELFLAILENEISNIASIERFQLFSKETENNSLKELIDGYRKQVIEASDFIFPFYLLEDQVQEHMLIEKVDRETAIYELTLNLYDVQKDLAKYCVLAQKDPKKLEKVKIESQKLKEKLGTDFSYSQLAAEVSQMLNDEVSNQEAKIFSKKYIRYPESTARKEYIQSNPNITTVTVSSNKNIPDIDYQYDFTVAPSRIDFGKHVVASITTMMGRMLGANDADSLMKGKEYIDYVSRTQNSLFESAAEAGSVKVVENTCRAIQYSKAISFQGVFQAFDIDGLLARNTINSRNNKAAGLHVMEYGTMASTGYCITKEPLFILLGLSLNSETLLDQLGVENDTARQEIKTFAKELLISKENFSSNTDWELHCYEELSSSNTVQKYLSNPEYKWLPNLKSMVVLFRHIADIEDQDLAMSRAYAQLASKLIEHARVINETGIIQRVQLMNSAIKTAKLKQSDKPYSQLRIAMNASYKGNVSDERENANQYILALLLQQKQYLKNSSIEAVNQLIEHQINNYPLPREVRFFDPYVDVDLFMGGELKARAEAATQKLCQLELEPLLEAETIEACIISYGSDHKNWRILNKRLAKLDSKTRNKIEKDLENLNADLKYLEIYHKGFYKDPLQAFQGVDVIQLNSDHDQLIKTIENLPQLKSLMQINNPDSLLVLVDNPQQAKRPFLDFDKALEWMSLGGTITSHIVSADKYEQWRRDMEKDSNWARLFMQKIILSETLSKEDLEAHQDYQAITTRVEEGFTEMVKYADLKRDLIIQKFNEAQEMSSSTKTLNRYQEWIRCLSRISNYQNTSELDFNDWLILGGRWILNGQEKKDTDYIIQLFEKSEKLRSLGKRGFETMQLFINNNNELRIERKQRILENAGSTKEADLLVSSAADSLEFRALSSKQSHLTLIRLQEIESYQERIEKSVNIKSPEALADLWDSLIHEFIDLYKNSQDIEKQHIQFAKLLVVLDKFAANYDKLDTSLKDIRSNFIRQKEADQWSVQEIFGDHKKHGGVFQSITAAVVNSDDNVESALVNLSKLAEMFIDSYLIFLLIGIDDENEIINKLGIFFDQYLNVHEEDYPPYAFHSLCAGASYGFNQTYYFDPNLRTKMFKLACKTGINTYKILHYAISNKSVLKHSSQEYKDAIIGDYESGIIPIGYQHETICIEERLWDCMRSLRNFIRNYHDKHPLPIIIKGKDADLDKLFRYQLDDSTKLVWIAGLSNPGKHSWDLNCVLRSPFLRRSKQLEERSGSEYINISVFTPFLTGDGNIKQIYTSFDPRIIEEQSLDYIAPFPEGFEHPLYKNDQIKANHGSYIYNEEGFVHALVMLEGKLAKPDIIMSAHTHPQYINGFTLNLKIPEVWSLLSMQQMYSKTELANTLSSVGMDFIAQIEFYQKEFEYKEQVERALDERIEAGDYGHIENWILKASKDSGGRGISNMLSIHNDKEEIIDFIFNKIKTDDLVMQEFIPNNARSFTLPDFMNQVEDAFIDSGLAIERETPYEQIFFAMRSFQSLSGIKGYLFSANLGSVTVNAGQGAKMFYGEPIKIMPLYLASKIQKLLDEQGEQILKEAIPKHAISFAEKNDIAIEENNIGSNNSFMLNGLFDYIPYIYAAREAKSGDVKRFKVICQDNEMGGLDYFYNYYGEKILLASGSNHKESLDAIEQVIKDSANEEYQGPEHEIDIDLAKIELNSGLGQANLLQKAIKEASPEDRDLFLEWTEDLGSIGIISQLSLSHNND